MEQLLLSFIPVFVAIIVQIVKFILYTKRHGFQWNYILTHGHMPSAHSAFAISLVIAVWYLEGMASGTFAVALALAAMILDDAMRLRMHLGDQGRYLNMLVQTLGLNPKQYPRLKERVGHRNSEVAVGLLLGAALSFLFVYLIQGDLSLPIVSTPR